MFKHSNTPSSGKNYCFLFTLTFLQSFLQLFSLNLLLIYIVQKIISPDTKTHAQDNHISTTLSSQVCLFVFSVICYSGLLHKIWRWISKLYADFSVIYFLIHYYCYYYSERHTYCMETICHSGHDTFKVVPYITQRALCQWNNKR